MPEQGKIGAVVQATNVFAAVSFAVDFKNGAIEQFGRKVLDCEANGVRRLGKSNCTELIDPGSCGSSAGTAPPRRYSRT